MAGNQRLNATITIGGRVSATLGKAVEEANSRLGNIGSALGSAQNRIGTAIRRNDAALEKARMGIVDSIGAYYSLKAAIGAPVKAAADFETVLEDIGQKADIPVEKLGALGDKIRSVARDTNQGAMQIGAAVDALAGRGASLDVALTAADPIGRAAVAYRAATDDLAAASWAAVDNLKVPASEIESALDKMARAGKEGAFELRDMATYFPALGAAYQGLGQKGIPAVADLAAALQVVRKGTGDSSTAATNLQNVLQKIYAPGTVKKFDDAGVDVFVEMEKAAKRGLTPIEAIAEITNKTLNGDLSKMGNLFEDAQVQAGMRSLIQGMEEYRDIRAKAMSADGVLDEDYERRIRTAQGAQDRWNASVQDLSITFGTSLLPALNNVLDAVIPVIGAVGRFIEANPVLASGLTAVVGGVIALRGAFAVLRYAGLFAFGGVLRGIGVGLTSVSTALGVVTMALRAIGLALAANPIGLAIAAIAGGAYLIYQNWGAVGPWFQKLWGNVKSYFVGLNEFLLGAFTLDIGRAWSGIKTMWEGSTGFFKAILDGIGGVFQSTWDNVIAPVLEKFGMLEPVTAAWKAFESAIGQVLDWIGEKFKAALAAIQPVIDALKWVYDKGGEAVAAINSVDTGRVGSDRSASVSLAPISPPAYAVGGAFRAGPIMVGERGPEMRFENRAGFIAHNRQIVGMERAASRIMSLNDIAPRGALMSPPAATAPQINLGGVTINALPGQSPRQIAQEVIRELDRLSRGALYDAGGF